MSEELKPVVQEEAADVAQKAEQVVEEVKEFAVAKGNYIESYVWYQDENGSYNCALDGKEWKLVEREKPLKSQGIKEFSQWCG